jgi:hypothetical protein
MIAMVVACTARIYQEIRVQAEILGNIAQWYNYDKLPSNGLAFSCRERAPETPLKTERSRARSGQL